MPARKKVRPTRRGWRGIAILSGCFVLIAGAGYWIRSSLLPRADAQPPIPAAKPAAAPPVADPSPSDYSRRVVAYLYDNEPITREQFGDYLIERHTDKLDLLINKRIIDDACRQYNIEVAAARSKVPSPNNCKASLSTRTRSSIPSWRAITRTSTNGKKT